MAVTHPEWSKNANIYEVNIRQYTQEGTLKAFQEHLPRLQEMGVTILWLMPVFPIGKINRKGELGSYYSVKDYKTVNPDVGTLRDLKALVKDAHDRGMKVILDWVANHTAWDHTWTSTHPEWYTKDGEGNFHPPNEDWPDVIKLDYANQEMRTAMIDALKYWVTEADIDGYRCDVANLVPTGFWNQARKELDAIKPVFMLAESDHPELQVEAFDMSYDFHLYYLMNAIASGKKTFEALDKHLENEQQTYAPDDYRMRFTSNHDENSWDGPAIERLHKNLPVFIVLSATIGGMPLIYGGQEAALNRKLAFFEKDEINWKGDPLQGLYKTLLKLKTRNKALWNGTNGGRFTKIESGAPDGVYAFSRVKEDDEVIVVLNIYGSEQEVALKSIDTSKKYINVFTGQKEAFENQSVIVRAHGFLVLEKQK